MSITITGLGLIIMIGTLCLYSIGRFLYFIIPIIIELLRELKRVVFKLPIYKSKKLRFEIGMVYGWIINKNNLRQCVKNFYTWGRIGKITIRHKTYKRLCYLAAFSMGKPLESNLKQCNRIRAMRDKTIKVWKNID